MRSDSDQCAVLLTKTANRKGDEQRLNLRVVVFSNTANGQRDSRD